MRCVKKQYLTTLNFKSQMDENNEDSYPRDRDSELSANLESASEVNLKATSYDITAYSALESSTTRALEGIENNFNEIIRTEKMMSKEKSQEAKATIEKMKEMLNVRKN